MDIYRDRSKEPPIHVGRCFAKTHKLDRYIRILCMSLADRLHLQVRPEYTSMEHQGPHSARAKASTSEPSIRAQMAGRVGHGEAKQLECMHVR